MFFPKLTRRSEAEYHSNRGTFYANYGDNYKNVAADCQYRCVYCDITVEEAGGDELHLDHFRPQNFFKTIRSHPYNLVLACPKCNGLKKDDWPAAKDEDGPGYEGKLGYIDPFKVTISKFLSVDGKGYIVSHSDPIEYMIKRLNLNRSSRVNVRRKRIINAKRTQLLMDVKSLMEDVEGKLISRAINDAQALEKYREVSRVFALVVNL